MARKILSDMYTESVPSWRVWALEAYKEFAQCIEAEGAKPLKPHEIRP